MDKKKAKDIAYALAKAGIGSIPLAGAAAAEIFGLIIMPPLEKRRNEWMNSIGNRLLELEAAQKLDFKTLRENEIFIDIVLQTTQLALKTSEREKLKIYQNIIFNSAKGDMPDLSETQFFLRLIDSYTSWHIKLLVFFYNPEGWFINNNKKAPNFGGRIIFSIILEAYPELENKKEFCSVIMDEMSRIGLHHSPSRIMESSHSIDIITITDFGKRFLNFIKEN